MEAIVQFITPTNKRRLLRHLGMNGFLPKIFFKFRLCVANTTSSEIFQISVDWQIEAIFGNSKSLLISRPVFNTPDYEKPFKLSMSVMLEWSCAVPGDLWSSWQTNVIFSLRYLINIKKKYSTIEKEWSAILSALQYFDVYLSFNRHSIFVLMDHNTITFLNRMKNEN